MSGYLTEREKIDREIKSVDAMWRSPYRKGIIEGLRRRRGDNAQPCPYTSPRSAGPWLAGVRHGLTRPLHRYGDPDHPNPDMRTAT